MLRSTFYRPSMTEVNADFIGLPVDSFERQLRDLLPRLVSADDFRSLYAEDGAGFCCPIVLTGVLLLQFRFNVPDMEVIPREASHPAWRRFPASAGHCSRHRGGASRGHRTTGRRRYEHQMQRRGHRYLQPRRHRHRQCDPHRRALLELDSSDAGHPLEPASVLGAKHQRRRPHRRVGSEGKK